MNAFQAKHLREQRASIHAEISKLRDTLAAEGRGMTGEEKARFERINADFAALTAQIRSAEEDVSGLDALLAQAAGEPIATPNAGTTGDKAKRRKSLAGASSGVVFRAWARSQYGLELTEEERHECRKRGFNPRRQEFVFEYRSGQRPEQRDMSVGTGSAGGYLVPEGFSYMIDTAIRQETAIREYATIWNTETGAPVPYPTIDDLSNTGSQNAENNAVSSTDVTIGVKTFNSYNFTSDMIPVSHQLLRDSGFDLEKLLAELGGQRIGRIQGSRFTTGSGSGQPEGIVTGSTLGTTCAADDAITMAEIVDFHYTIDAAYRESSKFAYMCNDAVRGYLALLRDGQNRPLLTNSYREGSVDLILGKPVLHNRYMASTLAVNNKVLIGGDFSRYSIRDVGRIRVRRLEERYAEKDQVGFIIFMESDAKLLNTAAVKHLKMAAA